MKRISVGILAHVDAGKTTCVESFLYHCGIIRRRGRVDHGDSNLDYDRDERDHGITIYSKEAVLSWKDTEISLIDTPGHADFSAEMERILSVIDLAVVLISGTDGVQAHTETIMNTLAFYQVPVLFFVNKMDISHFSEAKLLEDLNAHFKDCIPLSKDAEETLAMVNEPMMNAYLETGSIPEELIRHACLTRQFFPVLFGSALKDIKMTELLDTIALFGEEKEDSGVFSARVFKVSSADGERLVHVRITGGSLKTKQKIDADEKVDQIRIYHGAEYETVDEVFCGQIAVLKGLRKTEAGMGLGAEKDLPRPVIEPCLHYELETERISDRKLLGEYLRKLEEEDPSLAVEVDEETGAIGISIMGEMQAEILKKRMERETGLAVKFSDGRILYQETIANEVIGSGHFEPLRHFAEVHVRIVPLERGAGIRVRSECSADEMPMHFQTAALSALSSIRHKGVLTGASLTDAELVLIAGKGHLKHTEGGDFRNAARRAVRQGLMKAESVLLEPYCRFEIQLPSQSLSRCLYDLETREAEFTAEETPSGMKVCGKGPLRTLMNYQSQVLTYTKGLGRCVIQSAGYEPCPSPEEVIKEIGYDPLADLRNPPGSVFCAHGSTFTVSWENSDSYMSVHPYTEASEASYTHQRYHVGEEELKAILAASSGNNRNPNKKKPEKKEPEKQKPPRPAVHLPKCWIIDGYNMLYAFDSTRGLMKEEIGVARERLIDELGAFQAYTGERMIVVFDGYKRTDNPGSVSGRGMFQVIYTATGETADERIEKLAHELRNSCELIVASSDGLVQNSVFSQGAQRISARMLEAEMKDAKKLFEK